MAKTSLLFQAVLLSLLQLGCSNSDESGQRHAEKAQEQAAQGELSAAAIEYKNALQKNPQDASARFALAELYLKQELGRAAEKELLQARQLGLDEDRVGVPLGEALLLSHDYKRVLELVNPTAAKTLEKLPEVESYVKNAFLGFHNPYISGGKERTYLPDYLIRLRAVSRDGVPGPWGEPQRFVVPAPPAAPPTGLNPWLLLPGLLLLGL